MYRAKENTWPNIHQAPDYNSASIKYEFKKRTKYKNFKL